LLLTLELALLILLFLSLSSLPLSLFAQAKALNRQKDRELTKLYQEINTLNDRLMYLVGRAWESPPPRPTLVEDEPDEDKEIFLSVT
jgi:hypothetical protein